MVRRWRGGIFLLGGVLLGGVKGTFVKAEAPDFSETVGIQEHLGKFISLDTPFQNETGQTIPLRHFFESAQHPILLNLVYFHCPHLCQYAFKGLIESLQKLTLLLGKDYSFITVSIDPRETSEQARAKKRSVVNQLLPEQVLAAESGGWNFLTGEAASIEQLAKEVGFKYQWDEKGEQAAHPALLLILTPQGQISRYLYGLNHPPQMLKMGLIEASQGKIGTLVDRILLLCYQYDPVTHKYSLAFMRLMQGGAAVTLLGMGFGGWILFRRKNRKHQKRSGK